MRVVRFVALLCAAALVTTTLVGAGSPFQQATKFRSRSGALPQQWIVVLSDAAAGPRGERSNARSVAQALVKQYGGRLRSVFRHALNGFAVEMTDAAALALSGDARVSFVEQEGTGKAADTQYNPPSWGLDRIDQQYLPLNSAYSYSPTGAGVTVYIIDSGIRVSHVDFGGRASIVADFVGDGQNGADCRSGDYGTNTGHGTAVASVVGGSALGVAKGVSLRGLRVFPCGAADGQASWFIQAVDWVTANAVKPAVANMSIKAQPSDALDAAVRNLIASGVTFVASAGNDGVDAALQSPARVAEAITVGATDAADSRPSYSNYGWVVDLFAPGSNVAAALAINDTGAAGRYGTSFSAPHVAGVAALYLQQNPWASHYTVRDAIVGNASAVVTNQGPGSPNLLLYSGFLGGGSPPPTGRWKSDGNGGCYWDPNDSGPDQCDPTQGRWKSDGNGGCYWDPNDSGPDQCVPQLTQGSGSPQDTADDETRGVSRRRDVAASPMSSPSLSMFARIVRPTET